MTTSTKTTKTTSASRGVKATSSSRVRVTRQAPAQAPVQAPVQASKPPLSPFRRSQVLVSADTRVTLINMLVSTNSIFCSDLHSIVCLFGDYIDASVSKCSGLVAHPIDIDFMNKDLVDLIKKVICFEMWLGTICWANRNEERQHMVYLITLHLSKLSELLAMRLNVGSIRVYSLKLTALIQDTRSRYESENLLSLILDGIDSHDKAYSTSDDEEGYINWLTVVDDFMSDQKKE